MKHKKYSKQLSLKNSSMLLSKQPVPKTGFVSLRLNPRLTVLDLSHQNIDSLEGIEVYKQLQAIDLTANNFAALSDLYPLRNCNNLKEISILNTPLNQKINLPLHIVQILPFVKLINGIFVGGEQFAGLKYLQWDISDRIVKFLLQKCRIGLQIMRNKDKIESWVPLKEELVELQQIMSRKDESRNLMDMNWQLKSLLPLSSISVPSSLPQNQQQARNYLLDTIIIQSAKTRPKLIQRLLNKIQVINEDEQKIISKQATVAKQILKMQLQTELNCIYGTIEDEKDHKHLISAETALDSNDRYGSVCNKRGQNIHLLLDEDYVSVIRDFIANQCRFLIHKIDQINNNQQQPLSQILRKQQINQRPQYVSSEQEVNSHTYQTHSFCSINQNKSVISQYNHPKQFTFNPTPSNVYNNPIIMKSIITIFQKCLERVAFRKVKNYKTSQYLNNILYIFQNSLNTKIQQNIREGLQNIQKSSQEFNKLIQSLKMKKMRRLFKGWKNVKKRRMAILKKLMKKKQKADSFMKMVCLTKWKTNIRSIMLTKMASEILIRYPKKQPFPISKKGINLAYQRVSKYNNERVQLRIKKQ